VKRALPIQASQQPWTISPSPLAGRDVFSRLAAETLVAITPPALQVLALTIGIQCRRSKVQDDGKFAGDCDTGLAEAFAFCDAHAPGL
jgi:hypothetical protein